jgi:hypothetical protein
MSVVPLNGREGGVGRDPSLFRVPIDSRGAAPRSMRQIEFIY